MNLREKIIDAAFDVFGEMGYEKATIAQIIQRAGSSKGGFYHHFKSKEDVLEAITKRFILRLEVRYSEVMVTSEADIITMINTVFVTINKLKQDQVKDWPKIQNLYKHKDSHVMIKKMADEFELLTETTYLKLINQGIDSGIFSTPYPKQLAGLWSREMIRIYSLASQLVMNDNNELTEEFNQLATFIEATVNHGLNVELGTIKIKEPATKYVEDMKVYYKENFK